MGSARAPGSPASLRTQNQQRVLDVLREPETLSAPSPGRPGNAEGGGQQPGSPVTQADLARITGLAPATVSNIVRDLASAGLVDTEPGSGRRGTSVRLSRAAGVVVGIDVGHSHLAVALGQLTGTLIDSLREHLAPDARHDETLDRAQALVGSLLDRTHVSASSVRALSLGLPAPISDGVVRSPAILPGWVGVNAERAVRPRFKVPTHVENDANLGALAEHRYGVARGHGTSVFVKISSGIGAGLVIDGGIFHGAAGTAGEIGHLTLDEQGPVCRCGSRGCLEAYASTGAIRDMLASQLPDACLDEVIAAARAGSVSALRAFEDAGLHLGWGLASVVNLLNPSLIVLGGDLARADDLLLPSVRLGLRRHALDIVATTPVVASELGERASLMGAVLLAAERTDLLPAAS